ncbi:hypothetical protein [Ancylomarina sp. 16SWW S1-10-2]|uniref:hypothetical protein n=1 Tax=Ancylomarina sp. 16SWW S1-10-2 TaxID=2499681 RepID=UPI0012AE931E|nr:hypothetical protein [Ancylomarina sp. 16SWW S1-10-2]
MKYIPYILAVIGAIILIVNLFDLYTLNKWVSISGYVLLFVAIIMLKFCPCRQKDDVHE